MYGTTHDIYIYIYIYIFPLNCLLGTEPKTAQPPSDDAVMEDVGAIVVHEDRLVPLEPVGRLLERLVVKQLPKRRRV